MILQAIPYLSTSQVSKVDTTQSVASLERSNRCSIYGLEVRLMHAAGGAVHAAAEADAFVDLLSGVVGEQPVFAPAQFVCVQLPAQLSLKQLEQARKLFAAWFGVWAQRGGARLGVLQPFSALLAQGSADPLRLAGRPEGFCIADGMHAQASLDDLALVLRNGASGLRPAADFVLQAEVDATAAARLGALNYFAAKLGARTLAAELDDPSLLALALDTHTHYLAGEAVAPLLALNVDAAQPSHLPAAIHATEAFVQTIGAEAS